MPRFKRMFVGVGATIDIAYKCGMCFSAVDGTFFRHFIFSNGVALCLTTRDGNNNVLLLAWCICLVEDSNNYKYFAEMCVAVGLRRYLNKARSILYSDRAKGITAFGDNFTCLGAFCFLHILKNCKKKLRDTPGVSSEFDTNLAWAMQEAPTAEAYAVAKLDMAANNPHAAKYLDDLPHGKVYLYAILAQGIPTMGHRTNNIVEGSNGSMKEIRNDTPLWFNDKLLAWQGRQIEARHAEIERYKIKGYILTPYAQKQYEIQARAQTCPNMPKHAQTCPTCPS